MSLLRIIPGLRSLEEQSYTDLETNIRSALNLKLFEDILRVYIKDTPTTKGTKQLRLHSI